jgi:hypothetical protein
MDYRKYTHGFVTQVFENGKCTEQSFTAGDNVEYEELMIEDGYEVGEPIGPPGDETYFPFLMEQPKDE